MNRVRQTFEPSIRRAFHLYWRWARGVTLGVRGLVIDKDQRIFLVTHTYIPGWQLPGGGVEPGETVAEALARELMEEGNIEILEPPVLQGLFFNSRASHRDHVALFVVRSFRQKSVPIPNREIAAHGFFHQTLFPRIRLPGHERASPRSYSAHLFHNGGNEMGTLAPDRRGPNLSTDAPKSEFPVAGI
jgi:8-oxo-dGTP pyrophosphatase MutT (NUDIX family)